MNANALLAVGSVALAALAAGCGSGASVRPAARSHLTPGASAADVTAGPGGVSVGGTVQRARVPTASDDGEHAAAQPLDPCSLVSMAQAQQALGARVLKRAEAMQGPTCVYELAHGATATLAVLAAPARSFTAPMAHPQRHSVAARPGACGRLGQDTLAVALQGGRTLLISAPCPAAWRLAALAVPRLRA